MLHPPRLHERVRERGPEHSKSLGASDGTNDTQKPTPPKAERKGQPPQRQKSHHSGQPPHKLTSQKPAAPKAAENPQGQRPQIPNGINKGPQWRSDSYALATAPPSSGRERGGSSGTPRAPPACSDSVGRPSRRENCGARLNFPSEISSARIFANVFRLAPPPPQFSSEFPKYFGSAPLPFQFSSEFPEYFGSAFPSPNSRQNFQSISARPPPTPELV